LPPAPDWRRLFEIEDLLLVLWTLVLERVATALLGVSHLSWWEAGADSLTPLATVALSGVLAAAITESDPSPSLDEALLRRVLLWGPLLPLASIVVVLANFARRAYKKAAMPAGTSWAEVPEVDDWPGPLVPRAMRRLAVVPYALAGDALVRYFVADAEARLAFADRHWFTDVTVPLVSAFAAYLFFVVGPRLTVGATTNPLVWLARFAGYFTALGLARWSLLL